MGHALIIDDDADASRMMSALVGAHGFSAETATSLGDARKRLAARSPDVVLLDLNLPDGDGLALLEDDAVVSNSEVVLVTGHASLESSIQALRLGASDYLLKPVSPTQLQRTLARIVRPSILRQEADTLMAEVARTGRFGLLVGRSAPMLAVYRQIARVAATSVTVLISGETGTGKELAARTIHDLSRRRNRPFLAVNAGAISPNLMESEIFGHERGSFTGADRVHQGFFERASGGTLFLDEITEMPLALQVKLLRVLETGTFMRVGSTVALEADVRVIAATNRDPVRSVRDGLLREDLLYRLNVFPLAMPPLGARTDDIALLADHVMREIGQREGEYKRVSPDAVEAMTRRPWPGHVRELRNALQRAWVMEEDATIGPEWLPPVTQGDATLSAHGPVVPVRLGTPLAEIEREVILATYELNGRNKEKTAAALGISLKTLYNRFRQYNG